MFVTGMETKGIAIAKTAAEAGAAMDEAAIKAAAAASSLHSVALVQLICVVVGIVICFLIPRVHNKAEASKE